MDEEYNSALDNTVSQFNMANTVTIEQVKENMQEVYCTTINGLNPTTFVQIRMKNGFVISDSITCVDSANYDENIGKEILLGRLENKVWELLGFGLMDKASNEKAMIMEGIDAAIDYCKRFGTSVSASQIYDSLFADVMEK